MTPGVKITFISISDIIPVHILKHKTDLNSFSPAFVREKEKMDKSVTCRATPQPPGRDSELWGSDLVVSIYLVNM